MRTVAGRPLGVALLAMLVAINGAASLMEAFVLVQITTVGVLEAVVSAAIGLALLHRAYGLWKLQRGAWAITMVLLSLRLVFGVLRLIIATPSSMATWLSLILIIITILYLIQPCVRGLFSSR